MLNFYSVYYSMLVHILFIPVSAYSFIRVCLESNLFQKVIPPPSLKHSKAFCFYTIVPVLFNSALVVPQEFFQRLERLSGYETVNLSNIGHLADVIFVEVQTVESHDLTCTMYQVLNCSSPSVFARGQTFVAYVLK